jgi:hypothetical protein
MKLPARLSDFLGQSLGSLIAGAVIVAALFWLLT